MHANHTLLHTAKREPHEVFYRQDYPSQESISASQLDLQYPHSEIEQELPQMMMYYVRNNSQQSTLSQGEISQSHPANISPIRRPLARRCVSRPGQGYGKLTFIRRPDPLRDVDTWTLQERQDNRRIVAFHKVISGEVIQLDCYPVPAHEYQDNMITISCIRWIPSPPHEIGHKLMGQCVFTSVDIILLLEKLVGHSFDVQEKNRIRRNLEGYKPQTVRKEGTTRQFFNQVMLYAQPKARNIEKDIKVFLWKDLTKALKKVVQKYSKRKGEAALNGKSNSESFLPTQDLSLSSNSQPSSTKSLTTQQMFTATNGGSDFNSDSSEPSHHSLMQSRSNSAASPQFALPLLQNSSSMEEATMAGSWICYSPDEVVDTLSISTTQITDLGMEYGQLMYGSSCSSQQALEAYMQDIPGDFSM